MRELQQEMQQCYPREVDVHRVRSLYDRGAEASAEVRHWVMPAQENRDFRGSDKSTHRVYCLDCRNVLAEMPQAVCREQKHAIHQATHRGEVILCDVVRGGGMAVDVQRELMAPVVRAFSEMVQSI